MTDNERSLIHALEMWLHYADACLSEFDLEVCHQEALCPRCREAGCINLKIRIARDAVAKARAA